MVLDRDNSSREYIGRVFQLDSTQLDNAILSIVCDQLKLAFNHLPLNTYVDFQPEITAIVKFIIGKYSYVRSGLSVGQSLLGLGYSLSSSSSAGRQRLWFHLLLDILPVYLYTRLSHLLAAAGLDEERRFKVERWSTAVEGVIRLLSVVNLLIFVRNGVYPTLTARLLRLPLKPINQRIASTGLRANDINHTFMAREHLWRGFAELLLCVGPLINWRNLARSLSRTIRSHIPSAPLYSSPTKSAEGEDGGVRRDAPLQCVFCRLTACLPHVLGSCGHVTCYQCSTVALSGGDLVYCDECGACSQRELITPLPCVAVGAAHCTPIASGGENP